MTCPARKVDIIVLHRRFGHLHKDGIKFLICDNGIQLTDVLPLDKCEACLVGKSTRIICRLSNPCVLEPFQKVHADLCERIHPKGIGKKHYYVLITDDFSRYHWVAS